MDKLLNWFHGARWRMSLSHCLEALPIQALAGAATWGLGFTVPIAAGVGAIVVAAYYYGREKDQYEQRVKIPGESNTTVWAAGIWPGDWGKDSVMDFIFPVVSSSGFALLLFCIDKVVHTK